MSETLIPDSVPRVSPAVETPRASASVVLLRDGPAGLEVLLLRRHQDSGVLGGMYVFPGGKLDADDSAPAWLPHLDQPPVRLLAALGEPDLSEPLAMGLYLAALREMYEEAGVCLVEPAEALPALVQQVQAGQALHAAFAALGLRWHTAALQPWSRWITPRNPVLDTPRFDTRFFLAVLPAGQEAQHDNREATECLWLAPQEALRRHWVGEIGLIPPQLMGLAQLSRHASVASAWAEAAARMPPCVEPHPIQDGDMRCLCYPGDPAHPVRERALSGPTRLRVLGRRFEPLDGFEGWFR